jgi:integrase
MHTPKQPWNAGRHVGQKRPFTLRQIMKLSDRLRDIGADRDLCLFTLAIDSSLRGNDLVRLTIGDLLDQYGQPRRELHWRQRKTDEPVITALSQFTREAIGRWLSRPGLHSDDWVFPGRQGRPLTTNQLRRLVKRWAASLDLDPSDYAAHSLRRSKPAHMYGQGVRPEMLRLLLGHKSLKSTQEYLGIDRQQALALAREFDCFAELEQ